VSNFFSSLNNKLGLIFISFSILSLNSCFGIFDSETFDTCGIFLQDFQLNSKEQADITHEIIEYLQQKPKSLQSLVIKNELSQRDIQPKVFRSMKYHCYLYIHINFGKDLFLTVPSPRKPIKSRLNKRGLFLIFVTSNPFEMFTLESRKLVLDRQYRIFLLRVEMTRDTYLNRLKPFDLHEAYFFCPFCLSGLVRLNPMSSNILSVTLSHFKTNWVPLFARHYYQVYNQRSLKSDKFCRKQNAMYMYKMQTKCNYQDILAQLITFTSGSNFTLKFYVSPYYDYLKIPTLLSNVRSTTALQLQYKLSSPVLRFLTYLSIIYCFNVRRETFAETNMWTKFVPLIIWGLVGLFILTIAFLNTPASNQGNCRKCDLHKTILFLNSLFNSLGILVRQSWGHKWKLLGVFELFAVILISIYENSITVNVVVPLVPEPFLNTKELYNNNYTFVVQQYNFKIIFDWFSSKYNKTNHSRVLGVEGFWSYSTWLGKFFLNQPYKYAIVGVLSKHDFRAVTYLKEQNDTCYQMYLTDEPFYQVPLYFMFPSAASSSMQKSVMLLQAHGFVSAFENAEGFRDSLVALAWSRYIGAKHGLKGITFKDIKNSRLNDSMITFGNLKSVLFVGLLIILSAIVSFAAEVCSKKHFSSCLHNINFNGGSKLEKQFLTINLIQSNFSTLNLTITRR